MHFGSKRKILHANWRRCTLWKIQIDYSLEYFHAKKFNECDTYVYILYTEKCCGYCIDLRIRMVLLQKCVSTTIRTHKRYNVWGNKNALRSQILFICVWPCAMVYLVNTVRQQLLCDRCCTFVARIGQSVSSFSTVLYLTSFSLFFFQFNIIAIL